MCNQSTTPIAQHQRQKGAEAPFHPQQVARPERFELPTTKFVAWYSIQLSYGRAETVPATRPNILTRGERIDSRARRRIIRTDARRVNLFFATRSEACRKNPLARLDAGIARPIPGARLRCALRAGRAAVQIHSGRICRTGPASSLSLRQTNGGAQPNAGPCGMAWAVLIEVTAQLLSRSAVALASRV